MRLTYEKEREPSKTMPGVLRDWKGQEDELSTIQEGAWGKDFRGKELSQVQRELTINCPKPIPMTDEDKQLINGKEDRGKAAKREIICGLTTNYRHNSQTHSSYFRKYQVFSHVVAEYRTSIHSFDKDTLRISYVPDTFKKADSEKKFPSKRKYWHHISARKR